MAQGQVRVELMSNLKRFTGSEQEDHDDYNETRE